MKTAVFKVYGANDLAISKIKALDEKTRVSVIVPDQANTNDYVVIIIEAENPAGELNSLIADKEINIGKIVPMYYYGRTTK